MIKMTDIYESIRRNKMSKFNPKKVPIWCKWIAVDENGSCWGFSLKPESFVFMWDSYKLGCESVALYKGNPPKNWKDELYTWS